MRVRGFHPFEPTNPAMPTDSPFQDWILSDGVFDNVTDSFIRDSPPGNGNTSGVFQHTTVNTGDAASGERTAALNADVIADILAATRAMPSWKACQIEGTSWTGTAEENMQKYVSSIGVQDHNTGLGPK